MNLEHNAEEMKTVVETFVIEETAPLLYDNEELEQWNELVNELGLQGQQKLAKPEKSPIPFLFLKRNLVATFETLLPKIVPIKEFDICPIPTAILSLARMSEVEGYFHNLQVWYDDKNLDPAVIGVVCDYYGYKKVDGKRERVDNLTKEDEKEYEEEGFYQTNQKYYLIGKWGDVRQSFEELVARAKARYIEEQTNSYQSTIDTYKGYIANVPQDANRKFN
jgi:hypothetical protein